MTSKSTLAMRLLAGITFLEGIGGLLATGVSWISTSESRARALLLHQPHSMASAAHAMMAANVILEVALVWCAALLWQSRRRGLLALVWTLAAEAVYFAVVILGWARGGPFAEAAVAATGVGNLGLSVQIATAYPLVAGALIFLAYRYLRIPAPRPRATLPLAGPAPLATGRCKVLMRLLAAITLLEGAVGLAETAKAPYYVQRMLALPPTGAHPLLGHPGLLPRVAYAAMGVTALFELSLMWSASLLWQLKRSGLTVLIWALGAELVFWVAGTIATFVGLSGAARSGGTGEFPFPLFVAFTLGTSGLEPQVITAYPLIAGILIFLAYRYPGVPARERS